MKTNPEEFYTKENSLKCLDKIERPTSKSEMQSYLSCADKQEDKT